MQVDCLAVGFEAQAASSSRRVVVEAEAALESEWATLEAERIEVFKTSKVLKFTTALIS